MMPALITAPYEEAAHYPLLKSWWECHGAPPMPPRWLSPLGLVAFDGPPSEGGAPLAACFLYLTGTAVCWMEGLVSNPRAPKRLTGRAADRVIAELLAIAKQTGHEVVSASTARRSVVRRMVRGHRWSVIPNEVMIGARL